MEYEYSRIDITGFSVSFDICEKQRIAEGLRLIIPKLKKKIKRIENNPKNEGQAHYAVAIDDINKEIKSLATIIDDFEKDVIKYSK
jgi:hypothetical protein